MSENMLSNETRRMVWERQNGMCALTGKKFQEFNDSMEADFILITPVEDGGIAEIENIVMIWKSQSDLPKSKLRKYNFPYSNFSNYGVEEKFIEIKKEVDEVVSLSTTSEDWRGIRNAIKDITSVLNSLGLPISQRNDLKEILVSAIENVNKRQTEETEKNREIWAANYEIAKGKATEAVEFAKTAEIFKEAREKLVGAQTDIRNLKVSREHRAELEKMLDEAFAELNKKQAAYRENFEMECIENYYKLKSVVESAIKRAEVAEKFVSARDILINAQNQIKDTVLKREQKDELFTSIRSIFDVLREKFGEVRLSEEEIEANYNKVKPIVTEAVEFAKAATPEQASEAREKLISAQAFIKEHRLRKSQNDELFVAIREVFDKVNEMSAEEREQYELETSNNFSKMLSRIDVIMVEIENAIDFTQSGENLATIRTELQLIKLKRDQRNKLFDKTRAAFDLLSKMRDMYNKRKAEERTQKLEDTISSLEQKKTRLISLLEKDREILSEQNAKLENSEDEASKASVTQIINIVTARIAEREGVVKTTEKRISDIRKEIERIQRNANERKNNRSNKNNKSSNTKEASAEQTDQEVTTKEEETLENNESPVEQALSEISE